MLTKIRLDYAGRNAIYSQEAHDLYYDGPEFDPDADYSWDELENSPHTTAIILSLMIQLYTLTLCLISTV